MSAKFNRLLLAFVVIASIASAQTLPITYDIQMQVRANLGGNAFNLPNGSTFNSVTPDLNDAGKVVAKVNTVGLTTSPGLWFGGQGTGGLVYNANDDEAFLSDPWINEQNKVSFPRFGSSAFEDDGLYVYDHATGMTTRVTNGPLGATFYTNPQINDLGKIGVRVSFNTPKALYSYDIATNTFDDYVIETSGDPGSPYSFLFAPAFNNNNRLAAEANLNGQPSTFKELRIWNANGSSTLVASGDSNTGPMFFGFDNSISMNNHDMVAFITRTTSSSTTRRLVVSDGASTTLFPTVSDGRGFTGIDSFAPAINDHGLVAFRGNDNQATPRDSVFVTDGETFQRIAGVGDTLMSDTGPRVVGSLMGGVKINNGGSVAFGVQFTSESGGGNAIFVAYAPLAPISAVSRKTHGAAGVFDLGLSLGGTPGIESRQGSGAGSDGHEIVVTFPVAVTLGSASVTSGTGSVQMATASGSEVTVNLTGVANAQTITLTLFAVNDGSRTADIPLSISFLRGDLNASGTVNASDVGQSKASSGQALTTTNFRADVNASGAINATDVAIVKASSGTSLPPGRQGR